MTFDFDAGALSLDLANTVEWHASDQPQDTLTDYSALINWGEAAPVLTTAQAKQLRRLARQQPEEAATAWRKASQLREAIFRIFSEVAASEEVNSGDLDILNDAIRESLSHLKIIPASSGFDWEFNQGPVSFGQIMWPVARSAAELLVSDQLGRVRRCADDRGCGYLFIDTSRNRSRLWCSMESCGNRAKARRHYQRQKQAK